jgi:hypothetical protein
MSVRDEWLRRAVSKLPCVACGVENCTQHAHSNLAAHGKGRGLKSGDEAGMALCCTRPGEPGCHFAHDLLIGIDSDEAEALTYKYIAQTYMALIDAGYLKVDRKAIA